MPTRVIHMPLSGRDRRHFARELRRVEQLQIDAVKKAAAAHRAADQYRALAYRYECEEWSARLFIGGAPEPSPRISDAIAGGVTMLRVRCDACRTERDIELREVIWPSEKQVHTLRPKLFCGPCKAITGRSIRPSLIGLFPKNPDPDGLAPAQASR